MGRSKRQSNKSSSTAMYGGLCEPKCKSDRDKFGAEKCRSRLRNITEIKKRSRTRKCSTNRPFQVSKEGFQFRWSKINGIYADFPNSITLFSNHLKLKSFFDLGVHFRSFSCSHHKMFNNLLRLFDVSK